VNHRRLSSVPVNLGCAAQVTGTGTQVWYRCNGLTLRYATGCSADQRLHCKTTVHRWRNECYNLATNSSVATVRAAGRRPPPARSV